MTKLIPPPAPRPHDLLCGLFLCASLWLSVSTLAAPFARQIPFTQPDGTTITLWGQGDEFQAVFETLDGYTVAFNHKTKSYEYADLSTDGSTLLPSGLIVGRDNPAAATLAKHIRITPLARHKQASERFQKWDKATGNSKRWASLKAAQFAAGSTTSSGSTIGAQSPPSFATTGVKVGLTLLVDFSDDPATIPQADFDGFCNGDNYTGYGNSGSVKQYYYDNSNHLLIYSNVVTLYVRVPNTKAYYNDTTKDSGTQANLLIKDAIDAMKALTNYNSTILPLFAPLTVDGSSYVVACNVFYAGGNGGVWSYGLWPHSWSLYDAGAQDLGNGKKVYDYQITNIGNSLELGTFCHENGHMLCGYPDIYDYGYDSYGGAGAFCLMDYNPSEINPVQICAYLKRASGWATTTELTSLSNLTATVSSSGTNFNHFYRYAKPGVSTEYFLVENRQKAGRDTTLPAAGIAIWHVDELGNKDNQSTNFNSSHANYEVSLMQADNNWDFQFYRNPGNTTDLYYTNNSATGYANLFSDSSAPSARWWDGTVSGLRLHHFSANNSNMTFGVGLEGPSITIDSTTLVSESGTPTNNAIDPGEAITLNFTLSNSGGVNTSNIVATLLATNGIVSPSGPQTYGSLKTDKIPATRTFTFIAQGACGDIITPTLQVQDGTNNLGTIAVSFHLGVATPLVIFTQNFDAVTAPALPAGWTTASSGYQSNWTTSTSQKDSAPNSAYATDASNIGVNELVSPAFAVFTTAARLTFRNSYDTEDSYDGGVLEIKIGSGTFTDILDAGGSFVSGGYNQTLSSDYGNSLSNRQAWSGTSGGFITTTVNLPASAAGQMVQLKWVCGSDDSNSGVGWFIDTISVSDNGYSCTTNVPPPILQTSPISYNFGMVSTGITARTSLIVTNSGGSSLTGTATVGGPFSVVSNATFTVPILGMTNVVVQFGPVAAGQFTNTVIFASNGGNSTNAVTGTGATNPVWITSAITGNWSVATNWTPASVPGNGAVVTFGGGGSTAVVDGISRTVNAVLFNRGAGFVIGSSGGAGLTVTNGISVIDSNLYVVNAPLALGSSNSWAIGAGGTLQINSVVSGSNPIAKTGNGTLILGGSNTYSGTTTVNAGTLRLSTNQLCTGAINVNAGTLELNVDNSASNTISRASTINVANGATISLLQRRPFGLYANGNAGGLTIHLDGGTVNLNTLTLGAMGGVAAYLTGGAIVGGTGSRWDLGASGGFTGGITTLASTNPSIISSQKIYLHPEGGVTNIPFNVSAGTPSTGIDLDISSQISWTGGLIKDGAGVMRLSATNNYSGKTVISNGTLLVTGSLDTNTVTVCPAATLSGSGMIGGPVNVTAGGILSPGSPTGAGTLSISNSLSLADTALLQFALGTNSDRIAVYGNLNLGGTVNLTDAGGFTSNTYTLITYTGNLTGTGLKVGTTPNAAYGFILDTNTAGLVKAAVMPAFNIWQIQFFGSITNPLASPTADPDNDGMNNMQEFLAGTTPTDPTSVLRFLLLSMTNSSMKVDFSSVSGKTYQLEWTGDLTQTNGWAMLTNNLTSPSNQLQFFTVAPGIGVTNQFYRIKLQP